MPASNYEEYRQARIDRLRARAEAATAQADMFHDKAIKMAEVIPFGQPILIGHYSERADRNYRGRIDGTFRKSAEAQDKAAYYEEKAEAAENNRAISSDDPDATAKLQKKIEDAERLQGIMKSCNKIVQNGKMSNENKVAAIIGIFPMSEAKARQLLEPDFCGRLGFPSYALTNNNANIRRMKERLASLEKSANIETTETEIGGIRIVENAEENRIQLFFAGKPPDETRAMLKSNGFRWSPYSGAWQRHLNNAGRYAAKRVTEQLGL